MDWARNHLSDYIFPQNASPPRSFANQNGPAIKKQLPADLHDYSRWLGFTIHALYTIQIKNDGFNYKRQARRPRPKASHTKKKKKSPLWNLEKMSHFQLLKVQIFIKLYIYFKGYAFFFISDVKNTTNFELAYKLSCYKSQKK